MSARYLLDTNIVSYLLNGKMPAAHVRYNGTPQEDIVVSAISEAEVFYGLAKRPGAIRLRLAAESFFSGKSVLSWDSEAARCFGELRAAQERKGQSLSVEDLMIAAHALALDLVLITHDKAFAFVDDLKIEDWTER
jgi:tRNA(fMet)-specific endonuclease VapC